ncbi:hypothetical protein [Nocardioides marmoraquaticus]
MNLRHAAKALTVAAASVAVIALGSPAHADTAWEKAPTGVVKTQDTAWE